MSNSRILSLALTASLCLATAGQAAPVSLNLSYGLWQITSAGSTSGTPSIPAAEMANLTPAQKAKVAAMMSSAMATANKPHTYQSCITAESLQRGFKDPELSNGCRQTVVSSTATEMEIKFACTGSEPMQGTFYFQVSSPEAIAGTGEVSVSQGGSPMQISRQITGKWLSADCGNVKP